MRPLLLFVTRHHIGRDLSHALIGYEMRHLKERYPDAAAMVAGITHACQDRPPAVVMAIMPDEWECAFYTLLTARFPDVAIVRAARLHKRWLGRFYLQTLVHGRIVETIWKPEQGLRR